MLKQQKQAYLFQWNHLQIKAINIKVKFACRCFLEYQIDSKIYRTKQIKIDSKNVHYQINEYLQAQKIEDTINIKKPRQKLIITVKLLSSKGLSFTIGSIELNPQIILRHGNRVQLKIMQTQDIEAICIFQYDKIEVQEFQTPKRQLNQYNAVTGQNIHQLTGSQKSKNSKFQLEFEELKDDYFRLKDKFLKYEDSNIDKGSIKQKWSSQQAKISEFQQLKQRNKIFEDRILMLQKELVRNNELFNKQKEILSIFQSNLKEKNIQIEDLRKAVKDINLKYEQIYKQNCTLEQQKIRILMDQFKNEKQKCSLGEYMTHMFEQVYHVIESIFKRKITNISSLAQSKQLKKKSANNIKSNEGPIKQLFYSTDFKRSKESIAEDVSIDLSASEINSMTHELQMKQIFKEFQPQIISGFSEQCIENVKNYCCKIERIVHQSVQKLFKKIIELTSYNQQYRRQINRQKQQFQNNEQSLIDYLQQLQNGLQRQLVLSKEKDVQLQHKDEVIQSLNQIIRDKEIKIKELEEAYQKLQDLKNQIKAQLHQNNYIYAMKEEEFIKKIYQLQTGFQKPQYHQPTQHQKISHIFHRKPTILSDNANEQQYFQNEVIYQSPHLSKRNTLGHENQPLQNGLNEDQQANLRYTMLKDRRNSLIKKLREQMDVKSIDEQEECSNNKEQKVIEEQFLKVLV